VTDASLKRLGRAIGHDLPAVDNGDAVGKLIGLLEVLGGEEYGGAVLHVQAAYLIPQRHAGYRVEPGGGLIEK
jgi:hypothetical protein